MYKYLGDRLTSLKYKKGIFIAVKKGSKCIRGRNGNMLVEDINGNKVVVLARLLRKL